MESHFEKKTFLKRITLFVRPYFTSFSSNPFFHLKSLLIIFYEIDYNHRVSSVCWLSIVITLVLLCSLQYGKSMPVEMQHHHRTLHTGCWSWQDMWLINRTQGEIFLQCYQRTVRTVYVLRMWWKLQQLSVHNYRPYSYIYITIWN